MKIRRLLSLLLILAILLSFTLSSSAIPLPLFEDDDETEEIEKETIEDEKDDEIDGFSVLQYADPMEIFKDEPHAALLVNLDSGTTLFELDIHEKNYPASLTKIMTCYLALKYGNLSDVLTVSAEALENLHESGSTADLLEGEQMTLENMLYCTMVASANEACNVIAEHISGSVDAFVDLMNQTAAELGCTGTHFVNPHGLHDEDHYTTAHDLYLIVNEALKDSNFKKITSVDTYTVPATNLSPERKLTSTNMLLVDSASNNYLYSKASGIKTGFTTPAQCCLVSTADDGNMKLLSIMLGAPIKEDENGNWVRRSFPETINLFEYAFENYSICTVMSTLYPVAEVKVNQKDNSRTVALAPTTEVRTLIDADYTSDDIVLDISLNDTTVKAPIEAGQVLGSVTVSYKGMVLGKSDLAAITSVPYSEVNKSIDPSAKNDAWIDWIIGILIAGVILIILYIIWVQIYRYQMRKKKLEARRRALERERRQREFHDFFPKE